LFSWAIIWSKSLSFQNVNEEDGYGVDLVKRMQLGVIWKNLG
jgi:hypothetical protein